MKGLEALQDLRYEVSMSQDINYKIANDECDIIEKELKALEIIRKMVKAAKLLKNNNIDIKEMIICLNESTNDLLKEALMND